MVLSIYEAEDINSRQYRSQKDILKDLAEIEEVIAKRQVYLRFLQARCKLAAIEEQIAALETCGSDAGAEKYGGANTVAKYQQWKPNLKAPPCANSDHESSDDEYRWSNSHLSGVEKFWRPPLA